MVLRGACQDFDSADERTRAESDERTRQHAPGQFITELLGSEAREHRGEGTDGGACRNTGQRASNRRPDSGPDGGALTRVDGDRSDGTSNHDPWHELAQALAHRSLDIAVEDIRPEGNERGVCQCAGYSTEHGPAQGRPHSRVDWRSRLAGARQRPEARGDDER